MLSIEQIINYITEKGRHCPFCCSRECMNFTVSTNISSDRKIKYVTYECLDCKKRWREVFNLVSIEELPKPEEVHMPQDIPIDPGVFKIRDDYGSAKDAKGAREILHRIIDESRNNGESTPGIRKEIADMQHSKKTKKYKQPGETKRQENLLNSKQLQGHKREEKREKAILEKAVQRKELPEEILEIGN